MSRAYRIRVSETVTKTVHVEDGLEFKLEVLDVLPRGRMAALLADRLRKLGFEDEEDGSLLRTTDEIEVRVDPQSGEVRVRLGQDHTLRAEKEGLIDVADNSQEGRAAAESRVREHLDEKIEKAAQALREEQTQRLEQRLLPLRQELDRACTQVVAEALKEKARAMGEVEEINEDPVTGAISIKVRV